MSDEEIIVPEMGVRASFWRVQCTRSVDWSGRRCEHREKASGQAGAHGVARDGMEQRAVQRLVLAEPVEGASDLASGDQQRSQARERRRQGTLRIPAPCAWIGFPLVSVQAAPETMDCACAQARSTNTDSSTAESMLRFTASRRLLVQVIYRRRGLYRREAGRACVGAHRMYDHPRERP